MKKQLNLDSKIHHNNLLNNILAKIEGNNANADDAIMLDNDGYVSETNATNIFLVKKGCVLTPHADYCLPGITRATVMDLVVKEKLVLEERRISLSEFHTADERGEGFVQISISSSSVNMSTGMH
ncbi:hypothetical protein ACFX15_010033 [Malus domestica]